MLAIARMGETGEIFWCSRNWPYLTGFSFLKTIGSKVQELLPEYKLLPQATEQRIKVIDRNLYLHTFQLADSQVLIVEDRSGKRNFLLLDHEQHIERSPEVEKQLQDFLVETEKESSGGRQKKTNPRELAASEQRLLFHELPSVSMQSLLRYTSKVAVTDATILILGESGVGKEGFARFVHQMSNRSSKPYVKLNCGAIPETLVESELFGYASGAFTGADRGGKKGVFEEADGGTLFLDEIGELPLASQVKLLHVLQEQSFKKIGDTKTVTIDVRIIAATNRDLEKEVALGRFREDLYYRLCVLPVEIPPLHRRVEDIEPLVQFFQKKFQEKYQITRTVSPEVLQALKQYSWPGNIRQLENLMERLIVTAEDKEISFFDLPVSIREKLYPVPVAVPDHGLATGTISSAAPITIQHIIPLKEATALVEKELLKLAKELSSSTYEIGRMLGIDQSTVSRKLKQYTE